MYVKTTRYYIWYGLKLTWLQSCLDHKIRFTISNVIPSGFIMYSYLYTNCFLVLPSPNDGHKSDRSIQLKNNNMWLNMFTNVDLLDHYVSL